MESSSSTNNDGDLGNDGSQIGIADLSIDPLSHEDSQTTNPDTSVEPGGFGWPCDSNDDCLSQICILGLEGDYICTVLCNETCPEPGYACQYVENSGSDLVRICYPEIFDLCKPCEADFECGGLADRCIELNDGWYCGSDCQMDGFCPEGFDCRPFGDDEQCFPESTYCSSCFDRDGDLRGVGDECLGTDCNDLDPLIYENAPEICDGKDNDCDLSIDEDFILEEDPLNCGGCDIVCSFLNANSLCVDGTCEQGECLPGFYDLDPEAEGCEYECTEDLSVTDMPDSEFIDSNCDGIDGEIETALFVSATQGHPLGTGTIDDPIDSIPAALQLVSESTFPYTALLISEGSYTGEVSTDGFQPISLLNGMGLYGGYEPVTWGRSNDNLTLLGGSTVGVVAVNITLQTELANLTIQSQNGGQSAAGIGENSIALFGDNASGLVVTSCVLQAGDGGDGSDGISGSKGLDGDDGNDGGDGNVDSSGACPSSGAPLVGSGGGSSCGVGGTGGSAGHSDNTGSSGASAGPVNGGGGGSGGTEDWLLMADEDGEPGLPGCAATSFDSHCFYLGYALGGADGAGGSASGEVNLTTGIWSGSHGETGLNGSDGYGGGGGGGGGGATGDCSGGGLGDVAGNCDGYGGAGGGGGGAGCGASGGSGGAGGGGSFGLYLIDSSPIVQDTEISSSNGGNGGSGGQGELGGHGGEGGDGGISNCNGGSGGRGGDGTDGGDGGDGGGGGGGASFSIFLLDASDSLFDSTTLFWGLAGSGGSSSGSPGNPGDAGSVKRMSR